MNKKLEEINREGNRNNLRQFYKKLKCQNAKSGIKTRGMKTKDGKIEDDPKLIANIWKDYYHEILNEKEKIHTNKTDDTLTEAEENEVEGPRKQR